MANGNSLIEAHDYMEQTGCDLAEALEALNWQETEIRKKDFKRADGFAQTTKAIPTDESLPF